MLIRSTNDLLTKKTKGLHFCKPLFYWWALADLNRGPKDYEKSKVAIFNKFRLLEAVLSSM